MMEPKLFTPVFPSLSAGFLVLSLLAWLAPASLPMQAGLNTDQQAQAEKVAGDENDKTTTSLSIHCPPTVTAECDQVNECITFEELVIGSIVSTISTSLGDVLVYGVNTELPGSNAAMIFDSSNPSGNDSDLGTPNQDFGGPGVGNGGKTGKAFQNDRSLGKLLIVSTDLDSSDPDDEAGNGEISLDFPQPVTLEHMNVVDIDPNQTDAYVNLYGAGNVLLANIPLSISGDNGLELVNLGPTAGVVRMEIHLDGSGAIDNICYTNGTPFGFATSTGGCDDRRGFSFVDVTTPGDCPQEYTITRTWTVRDNCRQTATCQQTINIVDSTPPEIDPEAGDLTVECDGNGNQAELNDWLATRGGALATDNCGEVSWSNDFTGLSDGCGATGSATVTFTATDECGNASMTTATFTIEDTTDPFWVNMPSDLTVECDGAGNTAELNAWLNSFTADDLCGSATVTNDFAGLSDGCGATGSATVTFTATDECDNAIMKSATFTIEDTTDPFWVNMPSDLTVECDGAGNTAELNAWLNSFTADDLCGSATVTNDFAGLSDGCGATGSATVTFTATDECDNAIMKSATFTIEDTTDPFWVNMPSDLTVECGPDNTTQLNAWLNSFTADDLCGSATVTNNFTGLSDGCGNTGSATVTFTATDECDNSIAMSATFTIVDTQAPVGSCPEGLTGLASLDDVPDPDPAGVAANFTDNCGEVTAELFYSYVAGTDCGTFNVYYIYDVSDECGNTVQCQVIHRGNNPNPLAGNCPEGNKKLICLEDVPDPDEDWVAAHYTGNGPVTATLTNIIELGDVCAGFTIIHEYEVTDGCAVEICKVFWEGRDDRRPTGVGPAGLSDLICVSDIPDPDPAGIAAHYTDGCGPVTATLINTIDDTDNCLVFSRTYEYEITDPCGNAAYFSVTHSGIGKECPDCDWGSDDDGDLPDDGDTGFRPRWNVFQPGSTLPIDDIRLYPNPTRHQLTITLGEKMAPEGDIFLTIVDIYGRNIYAAKVEQYDFTGAIQLNLDELGVAAGTYFVNIRTDWSAYSKKLIVN